MKKRRCGRFELELPALGVGCWAFGGGSYWGEQSQRDVDGVAQAAIDLGANFFDTAEGYNDGESEIALGKALKGRRHAAILGSKLSPANAGPENMRKHCEASLKRLGTDYLDIYMLHWPINERSVQGAPEKLPALSDALDGLRQLKREGKIRYVGISNFGISQMAEVLDLGGEIVTNELPYNLLSRAIDIEILPFCVKNGIGIIGYSALMQGILSGKFASIEEIPPNRTRTRHFRGDRPASRHGEKGWERETWEAYTAIRDVAARAGIPMGRLAIAWSVGNEAVTCTLAGARNRSQLEENIRGAELELSREIVDELDEVTAPLRDKLGESPDYYQSDAGSRSY